MSDLIKQQAVIDKLDEIQKDIIASSECYSCTVELVEAIDYIQQEIYELPTVEAKPVVHGYWKHRAEHNDFLYCECSNCGYTTESYRAIKEYGISDTDYISYKWDFCPNCGCDMRKKVE